jgi:cytochrome c-type biogenesis protein
MSSLVHAVTDGPLVVAAVVSLLVGVLGFASPCVLPLVPGYLSYIAGLSGEDDVSRKRVILGSALFVAGFTTVFVGEGVLFGSVGAALRNDTVVLQRIMGAVTVLLGLVFVGVIPQLQREIRWHWLPRPGLLGAPALGITFGLAWGPCLTPTVGAVLSMAYYQPTAGRGALLMTFYCVGLGLPFVAFGLGAGWATRSVHVLRRRRRALSIVGGLALSGMGILLMSGTWNHWMDWLRSSTAGGSF